MEDKGGQQTKTLIENSQQNRVDDSNRHVYILIFSQVRNT